MNGLGLVGGGGNPGPLVGQLIRGKYRVTHKLATGILGTAYLAEERGTGTRLVLKVFRSEFARDVALVAKLRRQMQAVGNLSRMHLNIVRVYDCDQEEDGTLFFVMERLGGRTLRDVMGQAGPLEIGRALRFAGQMATGLSAAHDAGIVHADVRPENFMVLGTEEAIKIIGFERARFKNVGALDRLDPSSGVTWKPEYVAPEQIQKRELTHQTDIYAFGVVLYEMLTGVVPFRASTPEEVLAMHLNTAPPHPKVLRPEIPVEVEGKVMQALEKEPKWRGNSAADVVSELLHGFAGARTPGKVSAIRGPQTVRLEDKGQGRPNPAKRARSGRRWTVAATGGLLILIAAAAIWMLYSGKARDVTYQPGPQQRPQEVVRPATEKEVGGGQTETPKSAVEIQAPPERVLPEGPPKVTKEKEVLEERVERKDAAPAPRKRLETKLPDTKLPQKSRPSAPSSTAPGTRTESPDPSEVIDWLLRGR